MYSRVHDLYPRDEIRERAIDDAAADLEQFRVPEDKVEIRHAMLEDGVLHYKLSKVTWDRPDVCCLGSGESPESVELIRQN
ncbi:hypothetical protein GRS80_15230 [Natrialba sp. INN-245]|nr:hypothetical protein [Natrialba sp. INN-245]